MFASAVGVKKMMVKMEIVSKELKNWKQTLKDTLLKVIKVNYEEKIGFLE